MNLRNDLASLIATRLIRLTDLQSKTDQTRASLNLQLKEVTDLNIELVRAKQMLKAYDVTHGAKEYV